MELLHYEFIQRAFLAGSFIAGLCGMLGLFLVLKKLSLIGEGLAHFSFGAIALGLFLGVYPFYIAIPACIVAAFFILKISQKAGVYGDAAVGIVSAFGMASGVILASMSRGFNADLFSYLFGNILTISKGEMLLSLVLSLFVFVIIFWFYNDFVASAFDEEHAKISGIHVEKINFLLTALVAITVVLAVKVVGVILISALLILPASFSLQIAKSFKAAIFLSVAMAVVSVWMGITMSFYSNLPAGATIVMINFCAFCLAWVGRRVGA